MIHYCLLSTPELQALPVVHCATANDLLALSFECHIICLLLDTLKKLL